MIHDVDVHLHNYTKITSEKNTHPPSPSSQ